MPINLSPIRGFNLVVMWLVLVLTISLHLDRRLQLKETGELEEDALSCPCDKYMLSNSIFSYSSSYAQLHVCPYWQPVTCADCIFQSHAYIYIQKSVTHSFSPLLVILTHNQKNLSPEILLSQPRLWNTIHRSSWWRGNCCKIQLEVYGDRWRWIPLSVIPLSYSLPYKCTKMDYAHTHTHTLAHGHTSSHSSELHEIHPQLDSSLLTTARESFSSQFGLSGQRFTAERAASLVLVGGGLLCRGIIRSHLIFISYWEIRDDKSVW